jgi:hypothetical protein
MRGRWFAESNSLLGLCLLNRAFWSARWLIGGCLPGAWLGAVQCFMLLSMILVEKKNSPYMLPQAHRCRFNMEPCRACGEKHVCHTETGAEKGCFYKKQLPSFAVLWHF